jgi:predicted NBD/HSP70 family sugar kinase
MLGMPAVVDNNVRAMALYEAMFGDAKHVQTLAFVYARIGLGAGLMVNGHLYRGAGAGAGEIGHTTVVINDGKTCRCGNTGCLETVFSAPALLDGAQKIIATHPDDILAAYAHTDGGLRLDHIFAAALDGDKPTRALLDDRAHYMGLSLANLVNIFNPEMILLGGIFTQERGTILPTIKQLVRNRAFSGLGQQVQIEVSQYGPGLGSAGAATLALDTYFYRPSNRYLPETP